MGTARAAAIVLAAVVLGDLGEAAGSVLCKTRGGAVILRETCKRKEAQLDLAQLGGVCPKGAPGLPGSGARVVDANGRAVGPVLGTNTVMLTIGAQSVVARVDTAGFVQGGQFSYTAADCSGQRYAIVFNSLTPVGVVLGSTLHYPELPTQSMHVLAYDDEQEAGACTSGGGTVLSSGRCCRASDQGMRDVSPVRTFDLDALGLVAPFRMQVVP